MTELVYGSVFSGIEAATVAWHRLGWKPASFSEIDPFCSALLAHHYPGVANLGDINRFEEWPNATIDLLVGGSPCQDFSIAGRRAGLRGSRGRLTMVYLEVLRCFAPRWIVWENVPGVLSSNGGRDFGAFLGALSQLGYGWAYRVLDAQYVRVESHARAVPQRRRRVILVGYLGDIRPAAAVLFEPACLRGDPPPRRDARQTITGTLNARPQGSGGFGTDFDLDGGLVEPAHALCASNGGVYREDRNTLIARAFGGNNTSGPIDVATALNACGTASGRMDFETETFVAHCLKAEGADASEDGTGRGVPLVAAIQERATEANPAASPDGIGVSTDGVAYTLEGRARPQAIAFAENSRSELRLESGDGQRAGALNAGGGKPGQGVPMIAFSCKDHGADALDGCAPTLRAMGHSGSHPNAGGQLAVAFNLRGREGGSQPETSDVASVRAASGGSSRSYVARSVGLGSDPSNPEEPPQPVMRRDGDPMTVSYVAGVRRLTPRECERLQGFPDDYTLIPYRGKSAADGPRYKALGNSMAINVMSWVGARIQMVEEILRDQEPFEQETVRKSS